MSREQDRDDSQQDPKASGDAADHEVNPAEDPGPRGNQEIDPERLERDEEDLDRTTAS